jgi:ribosomal protein L32E
MLHAQAFVHVGTPILVSTSSSTLKMTKVTPINKVPIVKKRTKKFARHFSNRFMKVDPSWRKIRGIDSRTRRRFKGTIAAPKVTFSLTHFGEY